MLGMFYGAVTYMFILAFVTRAKEPELKAGDCVAGNLDVNQETGKLNSDSYYFYVLTRNDSSAKIIMRVYEPYNPLLALTVELSSTSKTVPIQELMTDSQIVECPPTEDHR